MWKPSDFTTLKSNPWCTSSGIVNWWFFWKGEDPLCQKSTSHPEKKKLNPVSAELSRLSNWVGCFMKLVDKYKHFPFPLTFFYLFPFPTLISLYFMHCKKLHGENLMDKIWESNQPLQIFCWMCFMFGTQQMQVYKNKNIHNIKVCPQLHSLWFIWEKNTQFWHL